MPVPTEVPNSRAFQSLSNVELCNSLNPPRHIPTLSCMMQLVGNHKWALQADLSKNFPQISNFNHVVEITDKFQPPKTMTNDSSERDRHEREHRAYASLSRCLTSFTGENCISDAICASSTDNYPEESIKNTLELSDVVNRRASYRSSKGQTDPTVSETLIYALNSRFGLITEVHVHPFEAYFEFDIHIYSLKTVRFHVGYSKIQLTSDVHEYPDDMFVWTYSSPEFPMAQKNQLQTFKLHEPVSVLGGILKVELLGRVQTNEMDGLYYICITRVQAVGVRFSPAFRIQQHDEHRKFTLQYYPELVDLSFPPKSVGATVSRKPFLVSRISTFD